MTTRTCPRCHHDVLHEDAGTLVYCGHCGAPQVVLSEELLQNAELRREAAASSESVSRPHEVSGAPLKGAVRLAGLAGAVAAALAALGFALPPVTLVGWLWAVGAPIVVIGVFHTRFRLTPVRPVLGARLGFLTGLAVLLGMSVVNTAGLVLMRFAFHATSTLDSQLATFFTQVEAGSAAQYGTAAAPLAALFHIPEFRAGMLLATVAIMAVLYLAFATVGGAFAGFLRARDRPQ